MSQEGLVGMGVYLVEGTVELDPMTDRLIIRTVDPNGNPVDFDPQVVLRQLKDQEIRVVIAPLMAVREVERLVRNQQAQGENVTLGEPPGEGKKVELTASLAGGKGSLKS